VLATLENLYGLPKFLTKRDAHTHAFDHLFSEALEGPNRHAGEAAARPAWAPARLEGELVNFRSENTY
jgi:hypothetical protein